MADGKHISNPPAQAETPQQVSTDGTSAAVEEARLRGDSHGHVVHAPTSRDAAGEQEGNCPLWDGQIIDATLPPV
jgi:hypothetical protein